MSSIIIIVLMIAFMYFFMIRPQQKQRKEHQSMVNHLKKGDQVVMISRLHGVIDEINTTDQTVTIDCEGVYLTFDLSAIARVIPSKTQAAEAQPASQAAASEEPASEASDAPASEAAPASESAEAADDQKPAESDSADADK
ncbi:preprotein translocase subunit YajC [Limosilactobacillus mucosae]|jgi:preprotein translocase subunit YajC|nr:preprotein translocase subunit YajC [Limosilactobacillus mucosae]RRG07410.1 MAG: preprotein translocase subunit YajC [Lactobacillus sp.]MCF0118328.1 preprotein translocase subunit YajC [Limosilactobacillus mucosae]MCI1489746.1 preprotein translocase subunit YajC [Limosilactobacillus mucosae]MCI1526198.1 preprotein translocase subunit YajC [Limosilactobacillus mucosae]MCI6053259.1 preprotein translocase subunit YajC [Limosilactobacillus mucosae]